MEGQEVGGGHLNLVHKGQYYLAARIRPLCHKAGVCVEGGAGQEAGGEEAAVHIAGICTVGFPW